MTAAIKQHTSTTAFMIPFFNVFSSIICIFSLRTRGRVHIFHPAPRQNSECPTARTLPIVMRFLQNLNYYFTKIFDIDGVCSGACAFH